jgi:hypothetical protein
MFFFGYLYYNITLSMSTCEFVIDDARNVQYRAEKNT